MNNETSQINISTNVDDSSLQELQTHLIELENNSFVIDFDVSTLDNASINIKNFTNTFNGLISQINILFPSLGLLSEAIKENDDSSSSASESILGLYDSFVKILDVLGKFNTVSRGVLDILKFLTKTKTVSEAIEKIGKSAKNVGGKLKHLGTAFYNSGRQALIAAGNYLRAGLQAAVGAVRTAIMTAATWLMAAAQTALNFVMSINPIFLIVMAIVALIAVLAYLYYNCEEVKAVIDGLWQGLQQVAGIIWGALIGAWNALVGALTGAYDAIVNFVTGAIEWICQLPGQIWSFLSSVISSIISWGSSILTAGLNAARNFINGVMGFFTSLPSRVYNAIRGVVDHFRSVFASAGQAAYNAMLKTPILGDLIRAGGNVIGWLMGNNASGNPYEEALANAAGNPFEESFSNGTSMYPAARANVVNNFNGLITERDVVNLIIEITEDHKYRESLRS